MLVLALDCAQRFCSVAVYDAGARCVLSAMSPDIGRGHAERLPAVLGEGLEAAGCALADIGRVAVTVGPGSFAGIRVGVAFARGLALALGRPAVGLSSLATLAAPAAAAQAGPVMAVLDARRDRVWAAVVAPDGGWLSGPAEWTPEEAARIAARHQARLVGSGLPLLTAIDPALRPVSSGDPLRCAPDIAEVARMAATLDPELNPAEPVYLRPADAKPQDGFAIRRSG